jgi:hypothetical protein
MSGIFKKWQPIYAEYRIATFPIDHTKRPRITSWQKVGLKGSAELAAKFQDANALGYVTGRRSNVTVVDIDTTDEKMAADAIRQHGEPRIITRTASGKLHLYYRYDGERRQIRPWPDVPIDVLGDNGFVLGPPSKLANGFYEIIQGDLNDLDHLRPMASNRAENTVIRQGKPVTWTELRDGDIRNRALLERLMRVAPQCESIDELREIALEANQLFREPIMEQNRIDDVVKSAWKYEQAGMNFFVRPRIVIDHDTFDTLGKTRPDALLLLLRLERYHGGNDKFALANSMAASMGWGLPRWQEARDVLVMIGQIRCIRRGGRGPNDPPIYGWGTRGL